MASKVTSSAQRSKGKAKKPVTTTKGRANRQSVSTAKPTSSDSRATNTGARVTNSSQRTNTGSAKVTGQPAKPQQALPPGKPRPVRASIGNVTGPASNPKPPTPKPSGTFKAPSIPKAASKDIPSPPKPSGMGSMRTGVASIAGSLVGNALSPYAFKAGKALGNAIKRTSEKRPAPGGATTKSQTIGDSTKGGGLDKNRPAPRKPKPVGNIPPGEGTGRGSPNDPPRRASTSGRGSSSGGRTSGGGSSAPSRPAARPAAPAMPSVVTKATPAAAAKPADNKPASGGSYGSDGKQLYNADKKNNPLFQRTFGYQTGNAPDQKESQAKRAAELKSRDFNKDAETTIAPLKSDYKLPEKKAKGSLREFDPRKRRNPYA